MSRDLSIPYRFLEIAQACERFKRKDLALSWAEKGIAAFPADKGDPALRSFLAGMYVDVGRIDGAFKLLWKNFELSENHFLEAYKELKKVGEAVGFWKEWQETAIGYLRGGKGIGQQGGLVMILIHEGWLKKAYEDACTHGCPIYVWDALVAALFKSEPELAYDTYKMVYGIAMEGYSRGPVARKEISDAVKKIFTLAKKIGCIADFEMWLGEQKEIFKRRTGFLNDLKKMKL